MCQLSCPKVIILQGSLRWLKICFSDVRASFQLACLNFIGWADPVKITASGGVKNEVVQKEPPLFLLWIESQILCKTAVA
jgi:hypothetical protein